MENTSGQGPLAAVPAEVDRWNWGAFLLNWIWGIGNNTFIALLMFVPLVNLIMPFVLGVKGSTWAWRNKRWESVAEFKRIQRKWAIWGFVLLGLAVPFFIALFFAVSAGMKSSDAYKLAVTELNASAAVTEMVGTPFSTGAPMGSIEVTGPSGHASLSFAVEGPKGRGTAYVDAVKDMGRWTINRMVFEDERTGRRLDLKQAHSSLML